MKSVIYQINNTTNGKFYIGSAIYYARRWAQHRHELNLNEHKNSLLQFAWNKYGEAAFEFEIIEVVEPSKLIEREQFWIDLLKPYDHNIGYNLRQNAGSQLGYKHTEQAKNKMRNRTSIK